MGEASLDDPSLKETLQMLRDTASALEAGGVRSKLIIPDSQILYKTLPAGPESDTRTEAQIRAQLHGATPYDVDDLAFDWARQGNMLHLAVVARETLDEAEAFATEHRFNPVSFVARPDADQFSGEPFFGATGAAEALISGDDPLERDDFPVAIIGRTALPDPTPEPPPPVPKAAKAAARADLATPPVTAAAEILVDTPVPDTPAPAPPAIAPVEVPAELATLPLPTDPVAADADLAQTMFATARSGAPAVGAPNPAPRLPEGRLGMLDVLADKSARLQALEAGEGITAPSSPIADAASEPPPPASEPSPPAHEPPTPAPKVASAPPVSAPNPDTQTVFGAPATRAPIGSRPKALGWVLAAILVLIVAAAALWAVLGTGTATVDAPADTPQSLAAAPVAPQTPTLPSETAGHAGAGALPAASADSTEPTLAALPQEAPAPTRIATPPSMAPSLPLTPARAQSILDQTGAWVVTPAPPAPRLKPTKPRSNWPRWTPRASLACRSPCPRCPPALTPRLPPPPQTRPPP